MSATTTAAAAGTTTGTGTGTAAVVTTALSNVHDMQAILDQNKEQMPEGVYLKLCDANKRKFEEEETKNEVRVKLTIMTFYFSRNRVGGYDGYYHTRLIQYSAPEEQISQIETCVLRGRPYTWVQFPGHPGHQYAASRTEHQLMPVKNDNGFDDDDDDDEDEHSILHEMHIIKKYSARLNMTEYVTKVERM
jgi:hypothetical protein